MNRTPFASIDLCPKLAVICRNHGERYFALPAALSEAATLWGVTPDMDRINNCGVFTYTTDAFRLVARGCKAAAWLVETPSGHWAMSTKHEMRTCGSASAPSVWNRVAFPTGDDARLAAIEELTACFTYHAEDRSHESSDSSRRDATEMIALLEAEKTPQLALF